MIAGAVAAEVEAARGEFDDDVLCEEAAAPRLMIYFFLTLVLTNNYIIIVRVDECEFKVSLTSLFISLSLGKILSSKTFFYQKSPKKQETQVQVFRHHKNKSSSPIIVDNMSAIAQSAISFGTFPPSYPTFARDRDRNVSVSPVSSFVVLL